MPVIMKNRIKISRARVVSIYILCAVWSGFSPLENYLRNGFVEYSDIVVSSLTFVVGAIVVTATMLILSKYNRTLDQGVESNIKDD